MQSKIDFSDAIQCYINDFIAVGKTPEFSAGRSNNGGRSMPPVRGGMRINSKGFVSRQAHDWIAWGHAQTFGPVDFSALRMLISGSREISERSGSATKYPSEFELMKITAEIYFTGIAIFDSITSNFNECRAERDMFLAACVAGRRYNSEMSKYEIAAIFNIDKAKMQGARPCGVANNRVSEVLRDYEQEIYDYYN